MMEREVGVEVSCTFGLSPHPKIAKPGGAQLAVWAMCLDLGLVFWLFKKKVWPIIKKLVVWGGSWQPGFRFDPKAKIWLRNIFWIHIPCSYGNHAFPRYNDQDCSIDIRRLMILILILNSILSLKLSAIRSWSNGLDRLMAGNPFSYFFCIELMWLTKSGWSVNSIAHLLFLIF